MPCLVSFSKKEMLSSSPRSISVLAGCTGGDGVDALGAVEHGFGSSLPGRSHPPHSSGWSLSLQSSGDGERDDDGRRWGDDGTGSADHQRLPADGTGRRRARYNIQGAQFAPFVFKNPACLRAVAQYNSVHCNPEIFDTANAEGRELIRCAYKSLQIVSNA